MLRFLVLVLLLANLGFYSWTQGWLDPLVGVSPSGDREPERFARQVRPETVRILAPQGSAPVAALPAEPGFSCLEAGPFTPAQLPLAEAAMANAVPGLAFSTLRSERPGVWLVYLGRMPSRAALAAKQAELERIRIPYETVTGASELEPGLSIGRFDDRVEAESALAQFTLRGVSDARVVELRAPSTLHRLRVPRADAATAARLSALRLDALGRGFGACPAG